MKIGNKEIKCPVCNSTDIQCIEKKIFYNTDKIENNDFTIKYYCDCNVCEHEENFTICVKGTLNIITIENEEN